MDAVRIGPRQSSTEGYLGEGFVQCRRLRHANPPPTPSLPRGSLWPIRPTPPHPPHPAPRCRKRSHNARLLTGASAPDTTSR
eukprot:365737-Chlamydomonas_euryale.AAC.8